MLGLGSIISPKAVLGIVRTSIEKTIKQPMPKFDIIYNHVEKDISFKLYNYNDGETFYPFKTIIWPEGKQFSGVLLKAIADKGISTDDNIQYVIVSYPELIVNCYYEKNGEKLTKQYKY